jgi:hypothetical protein
MGITLIKRREYEHIFHCHKFLQKMKQAGGSDMLSGRQEGGMNSLVLHFPKRKRMYFSCLSKPLDPLLLLLVMIK